MVDLNIPALLRRLPEDIQICSAPASPAELKLHEDKSLGFIFPGKRYGLDLSKIRAFRLMKGRSRWVEIGTYDKGNLSYISDILADNATLIDVDIAPNEDRAIMLAGSLKKDQVHHQVVGDSRNPSTADRVASILGGARADGIFIDGNHVAQMVLSDFSNFSRFVAPDGFIFFHDILWTGNDVTAGVAQVMDILDRHVPVYQVIGNQAVSRYVPPFEHGVRWGGIGLIRGIDLWTAMGSAL